MTKRITKEATIQPIIKRSNAMMRHIEKGASYAVAVDKALEALSKACKRHAKHANECLAIEAVYNWYDAQGFKRYSPCIVIGRLKHTKETEAHIIIFCRVTKTVALKPFERLSDAKQVVLNYNEHLTLNKYLSGWLKHSSKVLDKLSYTFTSLLNVRLIKGEALPIQRHTQRL